MEQDGKMRIRLSESEDGRVRFEVYPARLRELLGEHSLPRARKRSRR